MGSRTGEGLKVVQRSEPATQQVNGLDTENLPAVAAQ